MNWIASPPNGTERGSMCPFCVLTAAAIVSGSVSAGGLGVFLLRKLHVRSGGPEEALSHPTEAIDSLPVPSVHTSPSRRIP